jgi:hypothetical protein
MTMSDVEESFVLVAKHELEISKGLDESPRAAPAAKNVSSPATKPASSNLEVAGQQGEAGQLMAAIDYSLTSKRGQYISSLAG